MKTFTCSTLAFVLLGMGTLSAAPARPNILFIMSDDHTTQAIGAYATVLKPLNPTPTIDALAREGITFDNAFCGKAICTPSRACIITGRYNHNNGVFDLGGRIQLKAQLAQLRRDIGDDGSYHPACEKVVQEFWDYDEADRQKAREISHQFLARRQAELQRRK